MLMYALFTLSASILVVLKGFVVQSGLLQILMLSLVYCRSCKRTDVPVMRVRTDLGLHEKITSRLANTLSEYRGAQSIFKEFIANADDAGASSVTIALDKTQYGTENLWSSELALFQGPALLIYNNAEFREEDRENMTRNFANSNKRADETKIGKYGLGISTAFGYSDVFTCLGGDTLMILDPSNTYLPAPDQQTGELQPPGAGRIDNLGLGVADLERQFPGQLAPYKSAAAALGLPGLAAAAPGSASGPASG